MKKQKKTLLQTLVKEAKKSRGSGSGSLFIIVIFIAISFFGIAMVGGGTPSLRSTARPDQIPSQNGGTMQSATNPNTQDNSISLSPSPGI